MQGMFGNYGFARALCLNSEEVREEVELFEVRECGIFGFRERFFFFRFLFVIRDRGNIRKLQLVVERVRVRFGRVDCARIASAIRDALPLEAYPPADADPFVARGLRSRAVVLSYGRG